jgi:xylose isomerase
MDELIPHIKKIQYEGPKSKNPLAFKYYNPDETILGKSMKEHLRFSVAYWHTFRGTGSDPFGSQTMSRPWDDGSESVENAMKRMEVNFEFCSKLGVNYYCFHDRDIAPEADTLQQTNAMLDRVVEQAKRLQSQTGIRCLWGTANLFSHPRYMCGAATNPDAHVFAHAAAQLKKALEITHELGGENYVFWGGREGYQTLPNTNMKRELDHLAAFLHMAVEYKKKIGFSGTFLIEPKPKEPTMHQYDFDAAAVIAFLRGYGLDNEFKLNIECNHATLAGHTFEHELTVSSINDMLGSIDANTGNLLLGWDTDEFNTDMHIATLAMLAVVRQGGIAPGGLNFDAKMRRESIDVEDMFVAHISSMDTFARGLRNAARIVEDGRLDRMVADRYASFDSGIGAEIENGNCSLEKLEQWIADNGNPVPLSGKQELFEMTLNSYL